jgi:hypothetical protein
LWVQAPPRPPFIISNLHRFRYFRPFQLWGKLWGVISNFDAE